MVVVFDIFISNSKKSCFEKVLFNETSDPCILYFSEIDPGSDSEISPMDILKHDSMSIICQNQFLTILENLGSLNTENSGKQNNHSG